MPWKIVKQDDQWCVFKEDADKNPIGDPLGCHELEAQAEEQLRALYANVEEQDALPVVPVAEIIEDTIVSEFGGRTPSVPFAPGVDRDALLEGDPDPMFLILPISEVGRISKNGLVHDDELADALVQQIMEDKPGGIMGHIPDQDRSTAHPISQIHWVGAKRDGKKVWAKGYIPRTMTAVREDYRILKAKNGKAATSIYGRAIREQDSGTSNAWRARQFVLEQIDLAPFKRASLAGSGEFAITAEMDGAPDAPADAPEKQEPIQEADHMPDKNELLAELTAEDLRALPVFQTMRDAIIAEYEAEHASAQRIAELDTTVAEQATRITELEADVQAKSLLIAGYQEKEFASALDAKIAEVTDWNVTTDAGKEKLAALRTVIKSMAQVKLGTVCELEQVGDTLTALIEGELKALVEMTRDALAGGPVVVPGKGRSNGSAVVEIDSTTEGQHRDADWLGI